MRNVILYTLTPFPGQLPRAISPALIQCETLRFNRALEVTNGGSCLREIYFQQKGGRFIYRDEAQMPDECRRNQDLREKEGDRRATDEVSPSSSAGKSVGKLMQNERAVYYGTGRTLTVFRERS